MMKVLMVKVRVCACLVFLLPFLCLAEVGLEDAIGYGSLTKAKVRWLKILQPMETMEN